MELNACEIIAYSNLPKLGTRGTGDKQTKITKKCIQVKGIWR